MCIDCLNAGRAERVLEICKQKADFGAVKLLTSIPTEYEHAVRIMPLNTLIAYSIFMLTRVHEYIDTGHVLIVQRDGWILNISAWRDEWLDLDYIGPLFVQYDKVGSGGFSLRSKKIMQDVTGVVPKWDGTQKHADKIQEGLGYYEDGVICLSQFANNYKVGSVEQACSWAQGGNCNPANYREYPFGFHGTWQNINHATGFVYPVCQHGGGNCACTLDHVNFLQANE